MSDQIVAEIARRLARALADRAHSRLDDDAKRVAMCATELVAACAAERVELSER